MKVCISLWGRFHGFNLAVQLNRHDALYRLITSYPAFKAKKFGVPSGKIKGFGHLELYNRLLYPRLAGLKFLPNPQQIMHEHFARRVAQSIPEDTDVVISWPGVARAAFARAKEVGALCVLDRGSSHPAYCREVVNREYAEYDLLNRPPPRSDDLGLELYEIADCVTIPSNFVRRTFIENEYPEEKLIYVPYGVDRSEFYPDFGQREPGKFRIIYVGQMLIRKGLHYLLQACNELNLPDAELWLVGPMSSEMEPYFRKYEGSFKYISKVPQSQLVKYYNQSDVFILPSIEDGYGMVLNQALACGLAILGTENTGAEEVIDEGVNGFVLPIRSVDAIKDKISILYNDRDLCRNMGEVSLTKSDNFTWEVYGDGIFNALKNRL